MRRYRTWVTVLGLAAAVAGSALAAPVGEAELNAVAFQPLPAAPIAVSVLDDSDENLAIKRELEAALAARGYAVQQGDAPLILTIDTSDAVGAWRYPPPTDQIEMRDDRGRLFPQGELDVSRLARYPLPRTTVVTPAQYRIGLQLDARGSGERLWQGWSVADLSQGEPAELAKAMVPHLADSIGRTVREQNVPLQ